jgi:hypothetical protein
LTFLLLVAVVQVDHLSALAAALAAICVQLLANLLVAAARRFLSFQLSKQLTML